MKSVGLQLGARKKQASSRRLGLRLLINSSPVEMLGELRNSHDRVLSPPNTRGPAMTLDLPLTDAADAATGGKTLDHAALRSLREMFLLLDEWERRGQQTLRDSSEECVTVLDTEIP